MDFFNLPPLPHDDDDEIFGARASLEFTDRIFEIPGTGFQISVGGTENKFDPFGEISPDQFKALTQQLADYFGVEIDEVFPPAKQLPEGFYTLPDGKQPEDFGKVRKRGSRRSVDKFLSKIPGWQDYIFSVYYDPTEDEYVIVELE